MIARFRSLLAIAIIGIVVAACQSAVDDTPEPTPIQWQRVTFFASLLQPGFAMNIPADWHYEVGETGIIIFNYPRLLELKDDRVEMPAGSIVANLSMLSAADVQRIGARNAAGILDTFVGAAADDALGPQYRAAETIEIKGRENAQTYVSVGGSDSLLLALDLSGNYVLAIIVAPEGELQQESDLLNRIFTSIELRLAD